MTDTMTANEPEPQAPPAPDIPPMPPTPGPAPDQETPAEDKTEPTEEAPPTEGAPTEAPPTTPPAPAEEEKVGGAEGKIQKIADDFVIPISDEARAAWAKDPEGYAEYAKQVATGLYPTFAPQINMGMTVKVLLDPYVEIAQQVLGEQMGEPNWSDPKWAKALDGGIDPKMGRPIPMPLADWKAYLMSEPSHGWDKTPQANALVHSFGQQMNAAFNGGEQ